MSEATRLAWESHSDNETAAEVAERFGRSLEWALEHQGPHRCVDGRLYGCSCLVSDPSCDRTARSYLNGETWPLRPGHCAGCKANVSEPHSGSCLLPGPCSGCGECQEATS